MTIRKVKRISESTKTLEKDKIYDCIGRWHNADEGEYWYYIVDPETGKYLECLYEWIDSRDWEIVSEEKSY